MGLVDEVIPEPIGGAHRDWSATCEALRAAVLRSLDDLAGLSEQELRDQRYEKFRAMGVIEGR